MGGLALHDTGGIFGVFSFLGLCFTIILGVNLMSIVFCLIEIPSSYARKCLYSFQFYILRSCDVAAQSISKFHHSPHALRHTLWNKVAMASCYFNPIPTSPHLVSANLSRKFKIPKLLHRKKRFDGSPRSSNITAFYGLKSPPYELVSDSPSCLNPCLSLEIIGLFCPTGLDYGYARLHHRRIGRIDEEDRKIVESTSELGARGPGGPGRRSWRNHQGLTFWCRETRGVFSSSTSIFIVPEQLPTMCVIRLIKKPYPTLEPFPPGVNAQNLKKRGKKKSEPFPLGTHS
ncbi:unnamed protein product [Sphenostylis stenocarpa]|uniref:Uncharacterized protein n=1 Tax=Sphenostylis stenocarpa TaxID=92480 RepID=A0AA86SQH8_9FABA|nr:unnamed protein product [Sphenostylis stenocarpa]